MLCVQYADKVRERARKKRLAAEMEERAKKKVDQMDPKKQKAVAKARVAKEKAKAEAVRAKKHAKKKQPHLLALNEWDELAADERAYKRMRKGKITKEEYEDILEVVIIKHMKLM